MIRHALTAWNKDRRIQGQRDEPLVPEGMAMAEQWAQTLADEPLAGVICSDLTRARDTARLVTAGRGLEITCDPRLREQDWGQWMGQTIEAVTDSGEYAKQAARGWDFRPPGGESRTEVRDRALAALSEAALRHPDATQLCVTHQGVLRCVSYHLAGHDMLPGKPLVNKGYVVYDLRFDGAGGPVSCAVARKL